MKWTTMSSPIFENRKQHLLGLMSSLTDMFCEMFRSYEVLSSPDPDGVYSRSAKGLTLGVLGMAVDRGGDKNLAEVCATEFFFLNHCKHQIRSQEVLSGMATSLLDLLDSMQSNVDELESIVGCIVRTIRSISEDS